jgi:hypothetical protein
MKFIVHGTCLAVSDGEFLDNQTTAALVRVVVQEWKKNQDGKFDRMSDPLFIDLHTGMRFFAPRIATIRKGDRLLIEGTLKTGYDCTNRPLVYIEVTEAAVVSSKEMRDTEKVAKPTSELPEMTDDFSKFTTADVGALPPVEAQS